MMTVVSPRQSTPCPEGQAVKYQNQTFEDVPVELDGNEFHNCTFTRCTFVYRGGGIPLLSGCTVTALKFSLDDAAGRTMLLLAQLYHTGLQGAVESVFEGVRQTKDFPEELRHVKS